LTDKSLTSILGDSRKLLTGYSVMTNYTKGGRGKRAPYETTHCRVPKLIKPVIDRLVGKAKELVDQPEKLNELLDKLTSSIDDVSEQKDVNKYPDSCLSKQEAKQLADKLLRAKKSKKDTVEKLLTSIYGNDITLDD
jgi:hypothetical protein